MRRAAYVAAEWPFVVNSEWRIAVFVITSNVIVLWLCVRSRENTTVARISIAFQPSSKGGELSYTLDRCLRILLSDGSSSVLLCVDIQFTSV